MALPPLPRRAALRALGTTALLAALPSRLHAAPPPPADQLPPDALRLVREFLSATETPGIAISVYDRGARHFYALGQARSDAKGAPTQDTVFGIGSVTKVFTATLLAQRVIERARKFSLDAPVLEHLPWLAGKSLGDIKRVTLKMLATHSAGFPGSGPAGDTLFMDQAPSAELIDWWRTFTLKPAKAAKLGTDYAYSNLGMVTLGYAVAGTEYSRLLERVLTRPLGMTRTAAERFLPKGIALAQGHVDHKGKTVAIDTLNSDLNASPRDMLRFLEAQLGLLAADQPIGKAIALSHELQLKNAGPTFDMGLGWEISHSKPSVFSKAGATSKGGTMCWIGAVPTRQQGIVVQINKQARGENYEDNRFGDLGRALLGALTGVHAEK